MLAAFIPKGGNQLYTNGMLLRLSFSYAYCVYTKGRQPTVYQWYVTEIVFLLCLLRLYQR